MAFIALTPGRPKLVAVEIITWLTSEPLQKVNLFSILVIYSSYRETQLKSYKSHAEEGQDQTTEPESLPVGLRLRVRGLLAAHHGSGLLAHGRPGVWRVFGFKVSSLGFRAFGFKL